MRLNPTWLQAITFLLLAGFALPSRADVQLPVLKSGTVIYSNVTVYSQTDEDLYISHAQGLGNIKISSLDDDSLRAIGLKEAAPESAAGTIMANARGVSETMDKLKTSLGTGNLKSFTDLFGNQQASGVKIVPKIIWGIAAGVVFFYLFTCYCLKLICRNAGAPAGLMIWFPVLQMFPLLRAAKMSNWCFLLFLIPVVNIGMQIWWSFRIAAACGKGTLVAIALILPGINLLAFLYLAFSKGQPEEAGDVRPIRLEGLSNA